METDPQSEFLSADEIWSADDIREQTVEVPEWPRRDGSPGKVRVRGLTLEQMSSLANKASRRNPTGGADIVDRELSVALTLVYGMVSPKLAEADVKKLREKSAAAITRIVQAISALGPTE